MGLRCGREEPEASVHFGRGSETGINRNRDKVEQFRVYLYLALFEFFLFIVILFCSTSNGVQLPLVQLLFPSGNNIQFIDAKHWMLPENTFYTHSPSAILKL